MSVFIIILVATVVFSLLAIKDNELKYKMMFNPHIALHEKQYWRFLTHGFIHADYVHLFFNMYVFWMFGSAVESFFTDVQYFEMLLPDTVFWGKAKGTVFFVLLYLGGVLFSTIPAVKKNVGNPHYYSLGASGAVSSIVFAYFLIAPLNGIQIIFLPGINIPAFVMGILYLWLESYLNKKGRTGIAHDAHIWGAVFGLLFLIALRPAILSHFFSQVGAYLINIFT